MWSIRNASSAVTSGSEAIRIAASEDETCCSPSGISHQGSPHSAIENATSGRAFARSPSRYPSFQAIGSSSAAPIATRPHATSIGDAPPSSATLMNRYGTPQMTETEANRIQARRDIRDPK